MSKSDRKTFHANIWEGQRAMRRRDWDMYVEMTNRAYKLADDANDYDAIIEFMDAGFASAYLTPTGTILCSAIESRRN